MENNSPIINILVVDDEIGPRESLRMILKPYYNVYTVDSGYAALQIMQEVEFDVITLDLRMPGMSGIDTLREIRKKNPDVIVIIITGYGTLESAIEAIHHGVFDYFPKPFNVPEIMSIIDKSIQRRWMNLKIKEIFSNRLDGDLLKGFLEDPDLFRKNGIKRTVDSKRDMLEPPENQTGLEFAKILAMKLEEKDPYTVGHSERVCYYSDFISKRLSLPSTDQNEIQIASYLHDIGKIGISNRFLHKKGPLTLTDWAIVKQHSKKSVELLTPLRLSPNILSSIQHHHEHFDGTGYPDGLKGEQIPLGARIIGLSDSYESMMAERPYRRPLSKEEAKNELLRCSGKQFDPNLVPLLLGILEEIDNVLMRKDYPKASSMTY